MLVKEFSEILSRYTHVNIIVYLHGNTDSVTLSDTKATRKHYLILDTVLGDGILHKLNYFLGAFKMAGRTYTDLNKQHFLHPCQNFFGEEFLNGFGRNGEKLLVYGYANTLLALAHAEGAAKVYLISYVVICDKLLDSLNYLARALYMAGASDTYCDLNHNNLPL